VVLTKSLKAYEITSIFIPKLLSEILLRFIQRHKEESVFYWLMY